MREIKFRAWDGNKMYNKVSALYPLYYRDGKYPCRVDDECTDQQISPVVIMQFTGREDADINGTEVYEGDIIENCDTKALQVVYWNEDEAAWYCKYVEDENRIVSLSDSLGNLNKVVGNIYENPELLSGS